MWSIKNHGCASTIYFWDKLRTSLFRLKFLKFSFRKRSKSVWGHLLKRKWSTENANKSAIFSKTFFAKFRVFGRPVPAVLVDGFSRRRFYIIRNVKNLIDRGYPYHSVDRSKNLARKIGFLEIWSHKIRTFGWVLLWSCAYYIHKIHIKLRRFATTIIL